MKPTFVFKIVTLSLLIALISCSNPAKEPPLNNPSAGLTILGLDGATWEIIDPLIAKGELPGFKALKEEGAWGKLATFVPTESISIWTSIATGVSPSQHKVQTFTRRVPGTDRFVPSPGTDRQVPALWNIVSDAKKTVVSAKWFATWPAEIVNGAMLSPRLEAQDAEPRTYPTELFYEIDHYRNMTTMDQLPQPPDRKVIKTLYIQPEQTPDPNAPPMLTGKSEVKTTMFDDTSVWLAAEYAYRKYNPDLYMVYLKSTDRVEHFLWGAQEIKNPNTFQKAEAEVIYGWYRYYDGLIQELLKDKTRSLIVVSDHGMRAQQDIPQPYYIWDINFDSVLELIRLQVHNGRSTVWKQTQLYTYRLLPYDHKVEFRVNLEGREPDGIVNPADMDKLIPAMLDKLINIKTQTGQKLFQNVTSSTEDCEIIATLSNNISLDSALDVNGKSIQLKDIVVRKGLPRGIHTDAPPGIIAIHGPGAIPGKLIEGACVFDVSPTALHIMGLPVAKDFDGKALVQAFDENFLRSNPVSTIPSYGKRNLASDLKTTKGDKRMLDELRALGYIE